MIQSARTLLVASSIAIMLMLALIPSSSQSSESNAGSNVGVKVHYPSGPTIEIKSESELSSMATAWGWSGNGDESNPFMITGYDINASSYQYGISIYNVSRHFTIAHCNIESAWNSCIALINCTNGTVSDTVVTGETGSGIWLDRSGRTSLTRINCSYEFDGIELWDSYNISIKDAVCFRNSCDGLRVERGNDITVTNSRWESNGWGMRLRDTVNITMRANVFVDNSLWIEAPSSGPYLPNETANGIEKFNSHDIDASNTVNGRPIIYIKDAVGETIPSEAGMVILANCKQMSIKNMDFSTASNSAIEICYSSDIAVQGNSCIDSRVDEYARFSTVDGCGIALFNSHGILLSDNTCSKYLHGIYLDGSNENVISGNLCEDGLKDKGIWAGYGIFLLNSDSNIIRDNVCKRNNHGIVFWSSSSNEIRNNTLDSNHYYGVDVDSSSGYNIMTLNRFLSNHGATATYNKSHVQASISLLSNNVDGNYWSDWQSPDNNNDGIVDQPYVLSQYLMDNTPQVLPSSGGQSMLIIIFASIIVASAAAASYLYRRKNRAKD